MSLNLQPSTNIRYPPFLNGVYFDEYFSKFWEKQKFALKNNAYFLDIFWCNMFQNNGGNPNIPQLQQYVRDICQSALQNKKFVFTICQWDDNICMQKPSNLIVYSMGTAADVPLPLIVEDNTSRLESITKLSYKEKDILCSFVGSNTHSVRHNIYNMLKNTEGFVFHLKNGWDISVNQNLVDLFINTTQRSKFALAPRGYGPSSFRFFEVIQMNVIPIYVHDGINALPFQDIIDYNKFCIVLHIENIHTLPNILNSINEKIYNEMLKEMNKIKLWFTMEGSCEYIKKDIMKRLQS
jgi:hypothetical protein